MKFLFLCALLFAFAATGAGVHSTQRLERVRYNNPGLVVDLGVGLYAFPLPIDWDGDRDLDLVVTCPDRPYNGTYVFENPRNRRTKMPVV